MEQMRLQAEHVGAELVSDYVEGRTGAAAVPADLRFGATYTCDALVIATGQGEMARHAERGERPRGYGVAGLRHLRRLLLPRQGGRRRRRRQFGRGGGALSGQPASKVTVVHRRESFRSEKILQERLFAHPKVEVVWNSVVDEILGQEGPLSVTGVRLKNVKTGATEERRVDGVFVISATRRRPNSSRDRWKPSPTAT